MSEQHGSPNDREGPDARALDRLAELASIGAGHAAGSLARLVDRPIRMSVAKARELVPGLRSDAGTHVAAEGGSGIFFELTGGFEGAVVVVFSRPSLEAVTGHLVGAVEVGHVPDVESAVRELGNILVSSYASAIADVLSTLVLPSVPLLVTDELDAALDSLIHACSQGDSPDSVLIENEICDSEGEVRGHLLLVPGPSAVRGATPGTSDTVPT